MENPGQPGINNGSSRVARAATLRAGNPRRSPLGTMSALQRRPTGREGEYNSLNFYMVKLEPSIELKI